MRWDDLVRWRSMDHLLTKNYIPEGCNFWDEMYKSANKDENGAEVTFKDSGEEGSNISSRSFKYLRPYAILKTNNDDISRVYLAEGTLSQSCAGS